VERTFRPGDPITLTLPMHAVVTYWSNDWPTDALGLEHGPLVYALAVEGQCKPVVSSKWSTPDFPEWDAKPISAWNYGIAIEEDKILSQVQIERKSMTEDPWVDPPVTLAVPMKKIPSWGLRADPKHPELKLTPPLPEVDEQLADRLTNVEIEQIALVPYGATQLRLTIFPKVQTKPRI
jgi:uncharacterized protein